MFKRFFLVLAMIGALIGCNTPAGSPSPSASAPDVSPSAPTLESPSDSGLESVEPSESASPSESVEPSESAEPSESPSPS